MSGVQALAGLGQADCIVPVTEENGEGRNERDVFVPSTKRGGVCFYSILFFFCFCVLSCFFLPSNIAIV